MLHLGLGIGLVDRELPDVVAVEIRYVLVPMVVVDYQRSGRHVLGEPVGRGQRRMVFRINPLERQRVEGCREDDEHHHRSHGYSDLAFQHDANSGRLPGNERVVVPQPDQHPRGQDNHHRDQREDVT